MNDIEVTVKVPYDEFQYLQHWGTKENMTVEEVILMMIEGFKGSMEEINPDTTKLN